MRWHTTTRADGWKETTCVGVDVQTINLFRSMGENRVLIQHCCFLAIRVFQMVRCQDIPHQTIPNRINPTRTSPHPDSSPGRLPSRTKPITTTPWYDNSPLGLYPARTTPHLGRLPTRTTRHQCNTPLMHCIGQLPTRTNPHYGNSPPGQHPTIVQLPIRTTPH